MMGLFIFSKLLLMTLLLQFSEENTERKTHTTAKPDNSVRYGEFCLRISEDSLGTSSKPSTQLPTKSALPTQQPTQHKQPIQPTKKSIPLLIQTTTEPPHPDSQSVQPNSEPTPTSTQLPAQTDQPEVVTQEQNNMMTTAAVLEQVIPKCRCTMEDMKQPAETSPVSSLTIWFPSEMCNTIEIIGTLLDGREVCVTPGRFIALSRSVKHETKTLATSPAPLDTTTELPITTQPSVKKTTEEMPRVLSDRSEDALSDRCKPCESLTSLNDIDPAIVQVLIVEKQPSPCPVYLNVTLKNGRESCLVLDPLDLKQMMMMLEDKFAWTRMNSKDGCRCRDREKKDPFEMLAHKTTFIWPPGEGCHSADIIEISVGSEDVCVAASSVLEYLTSLIL
uniref:uncharacterized protein LOC109957266 n=1 Tax=Monopterus albus TaxID=43700 RepID=UPI0009B418D1|nr:uncharacterized protein LOC109957266 [Monopterus albus]